MKARAYLITLVRNEETLTGARSSRALSYRSTPVIIPTTANIGRVIRQAFPAWKPDTTWDSIARQIQDGPEPYEYFDILVTDGHRYDMTHHLARFEALP